MVGVIISLLVTIMVVVILLKKMKAQFVLFFGGLTLLVCSIAMDAFGLLPNGAQILPKGVASTGFIGFDLFKCITSLMSSRTAGIGLLIMSAAGYSKYMSMIGASAIMADYLCRPLRIFRSPYFVLSLAYIIGAIADLFIPSASGLAMLLIYLSDMGAGVEWISTLKPPQATDPERAAGSVFVVRADDTRYNQVSDLRTAFVAAAGMASFDGWITALDEVANVSQYPKNFFGKTTFLGASGLSVARAVLERDADVGILRVCELETLTAAGLVEPGSLRVVGEKPQQGLACVSSTELFPGLALAAQTYVPEDVRRRIAAAVYSMPVPESGYRWTLANDYRNVRRVAEKFAYAPTNKASDARFSVVEERYKYALVLGFLILAASMLYSVSVSKIVARRTKALVKVIDEKDALEDHARRDRERLSQLERAGIVSELSSMIAHELRQPVASLINYADGLSLYLGGKGHDPVIDEATREIGRQAERVSSIVERVRSYARQKEGLQREIDFCAVVKSAYSTFRSGAASSSVRVSADLVDAAPVEGDPLELELFVVNTLKNALHALQSGSVEHPEIRLRLKADLSVENNPRWVLEVEDNGLPLDDKKFAELSHPVTSEKFEGLGLGLSICRVIAERHRGRLTFRRAEPWGLVVSLSLPQVRTAEAA